MKFIAALLILLISGVSFAAGTKDAVLTLEFGTQKRSLSAAQLLANPATREVTVTKDNAYGKAVRYRALPLPALLEGIELPPGAVIEAVATDGFVASLPAELLQHPQKDGAEAFLAIEPPDAPWPPLPGKKQSAGPFYIVWLKPEAANIRSEQWPYMIATLRVAEAPETRWKELAVDATLPADSPVRAGQKVFVAQCLSCHQLNGAGSAAAGPDLNRPASPTEYFKRDPLKKYIRDPASLRHWDGMQMHGFDKETLTDAEIEQIVQYLEHMAALKKEK